jgi:hypothetical protein
MLELLNQGWELLSGLLSGLVGLSGVVLGFLYSVAIHLHVDMPRLEGLLVGVLLAWLLLRRDRHPVLRVLSAPLKLVVDILDLAWDQAVAVATDSWDVVTGWVSGVYSWSWGKVAGAWDWLLSGLRSVKSKLEKNRAE